MTRYIQMLAIAAPVIGLLLREMFLALEIVTVGLWVVVATLLNGLLLYGARRFRSMAYHTLDRLALLSDHLGMQRPYPMMWGYRGGLSVIALFELVSIGYFGFRLVTE